MEVKIGVKMEVKRYAQDVSIVNWYPPFNSNERSELTPSSTPSFIHDDTVRHV